jgi:type I restriction enzyme S subunit
MIHHLKPYPIYKDSGVQWLGKVPEHWGIEPAKRLFQKMDRPVRESDDVVTCFRDGIVTLRKNRRVRGFTESLKEIGYQGICRGDLVIHAMDAFAGAVGVSNANGKGTPVYSVCKPEAQVNAHYYAHLIREMARSQWILALATGIRERSTDFRFEAFARQPVPTPASEEQSGIVQYLDYMDRRIGRYIRAKQKLIKLLNEQKQAIIHQAITRGLDPDVRLKPSGVKWLGDIPMHWDVIRLKEVISPIEQGWSPQCDAQQAGGDEWGVLKVGCVNGDAFDEHQNKKLPSVLEPIPTLEIRHGDILVSRANTRELLGLAAIALKPSPKLMLCDKLFRFRAKSDRTKARFLVYSLRQRTSRAQIESSTNGASDSMQNIGQGVIRNLWISLPPLDEQREIVKELEKMTASLAVAIGQAYQEVSLLREYRTRLIADVVTGKLDVREAAAHLPDEADEQELIDEAETLSDDDNDTADDAELDDLIEEAEA